MLKTVLLIIACLSLYIVRRVIQADILYFILLILMTFTINSVFGIIANRYRNKIPKLKRSHLRKIPFVLIVCWVALFILMSIGKHHSFRTYMSDLGSMDQAIWNTSQGRVLESTTMHYPYLNLPRLSVHVEPIYFLFAGIYKIVPDPRVLLIIKVLLLGISIFAIYKIAEKILNSKIYAFKVAVIYSFFPSLQFITLFDFYGDTLAIPFLLFSYLFYIKGKIRWYWLFLIIALLCKEYVALAVLGFGITLIVMHKDVKNGIITSMVGLFYFLAVNFYMIPMFNFGHESELVSAYLGHVGGEDGLKGIITFVLTNPISFVASMLSRNNLQNLFYLLFPLLITPFRAVGFLFGFFPILLKDLLAGLDIYTHRIATGLPFLFIAFIHGLKNKPRFFLLKNATSTDSLLRLSLIASVLASVMYGPSPLGHRFWRETDKYFPGEHAKACSHIVKNVPDDVIISVSQNLAPHLTHRQFCYAFPHPYTKENRNFERVEYIALDTTDKMSSMQEYDSFSAEVIPEIKGLGFQLLKETGGVYLFKKRTDEAEK